MKESLLFRCEIEVASVEDRRERDASKLRLVGRDVGVEQVDTSDDLVERARSECGERFADLVGKEMEEVDDVLRAPVEVRAQCWVLRRDADRAGVEMTDAH